MKKADFLLEVFKKDKPLLIKEKVKGIIEHFRREMITEGQMSFGFTIPVFIIDEVSSGIPKHISVDIIP